MQGMHLASLCVWQRIPAACGCVSVYGRASTCVCKDIREQEDNSTCRRVHMWQSTCVHQHVQIRPCKSMNVLCVCRQVSYLCVYKKK